MDLHCFNLHWSYLISFNLSNVGGVGENKTNFFFPNLCPVLSDLTQKISHKLGAWKGSFMSLSCNNGKEMYKNVWCMCKDVFLPVCAYYFLLFAVTVEKTSYCCHPEILLSCSLFHSQISATHAVCMFHLLIIVRLHFFVYVHKKTI